MEDGKVESNIRPSYCLVRRRMGTRVFDSILVVLILRHRSTWLPM